MCNMKECVRTKSDWAFYSMKSWVVSARRRCWTGLLHRSSAACPVAGGEGGQCSPEQRTSLFSILLLLFLWGYRSSRLLIYFPMPQTLCQHFGSSFHSSENCYLHFSHNSGVNKMEIWSDNWGEERLLQSSGVPAVIRSGCSVISTLPGFSMTESSYSQPQFSTVQQLQDSSTLESQALSSSYHQSNLLHVSTAEVVSG